MSVNCERFIFCFVPFLLFWGIEEKCAYRQEVFVYLLKTNCCVLWFGGQLCVIQLASVSVSVCLKPSRNLFWWCVCVDGRECVAVCVNSVLKSLLV